MAINFNPRSVFQRVKDLFAKRGRRIKAQKLPVAAGLRGTGGGALSQDETEAFVYDEQILFVYSSNVAVCQYFVEEENLMVEYLRKKRRPKAYLYFNFAVEQAIALAQAPSKGVWIWQNIRIGEKTTAGSRYRCIPLN